MVIRPHLAELPCPQGAEVIHGHIVYVALEEAGTVDRVSLEPLDLLHRVSSPAM